MLRILPIGDSLTAGVTDSVDRPDGYRVALVEALRAAGVEAVAVGTQGGHEGRGGWLAEELTALVEAGALDHLSPDLITLLAGTNNVSSGQEAARVVGELLRLRDALRKHFPAARVLQAQLPPIIGKDVTTVNAALPDAVDAGLTVGDLCDGLHLTRRGYLKLALAFYAQLADEPPPLRLRLKWKARIAFVDFKLFCKRFRPTRSAARLIRGRTSRVPPGAR